MNVRNLDFEKLDAHHSGVSVKKKARFGELFFDRELCNRYNALAMLEKKEDAEISFEEHEEIDDVDFSDAEKKIQKLKKDLKACAAEKQEYLDGWQRARADLLNAKKRNEEGAHMQEKQIRARFVEQILPVCDSFEMALRDTEGSTSDNWQKGIEKVFSQLQNTLKEYGVTEIEALHTTFNPMLHEALSEEEVADQKEDNAVRNVLQKGYCIDDHLIRPAKVVVGVYKDKT